MIAFRLLFDLCAVCFALARAASYSDQIQTIHKRDVNGRLLKWPVSKHDLLHASVNHTWQSKSVLAALALNYFGADSQWNSHKYRVIFI
jgi:hypothetical protein